MSNFVLEGNFVMMDTIEFKSLLDEIIDILSSCESMINADSDECFVCRNDIKENENNATCESCDKHFHVSCIYKSDDKLADQRLIWICSCGNNNIAHRMFDRVCIPSHYNRYQPLDDVLQDEEDFECPQPIINKQRNGQSGRSKKRYVKKQRKTNVFPEKQSENDMKTSECNGCQPDLVAKENSSKTKDAKVQSEQFDHDWVTVKSKKTKLMEKRKARLHSHSKDDVTNRKQTRSINGVLLEPGVTYIGKAVKEYFGRRKSSNETKAKGKIDEKQYRDGNGKSPSFHVKCPKPCQSRHDNVQSYTECLLNEYAKSVQSPHSMEAYSEKCKETNIKQTESTMSWADVARSSGSGTRRDKSVNTDACTCHVFQQLKDDRCVTMQQLYGGGRSKKRARTKDGRFVQSKKQSTNKEKSEHEKSKSNQSDKNETDCRPNHDVNRQNSCSNQVPTMNADQDVTTGNLDCDKDKGNEIQIDDHSNSKADQSDKNESDCRPNHGNVNQNKSQTNLISSEFETCCICNHEIEQNESKAMCDSCKNHYHVTCKGFACKLKKLSGNTIEFKTIPDEISDILSMNVDQDFKTGNLVYDKDKSNEIKIDDHSDCDTPVPVEDMCARDSESHISDTCTYQYDGNVSPMSLDSCCESNFLENVSSPFREELMIDEENEICVFKIDDNILNDNHKEFAKSSKDDLISHSISGVSNMSKEHITSVDRVKPESIGQKSNKFDDSTKITTIAQGNFNQGHYRFGITGGTQCTANSLVAMLYTIKKSGIEFNSQDLDRILTLGNQLYYFIQEDSTMHHRLLMVSELPKELDILDDTFAINYNEPVFGIISGNPKYMAECGALSCQYALQQELCQHDAYFMTFKESTFAIIKCPTGFLIFDPHGRNKTGCVSENGKSILLHTSSWQGIHSHCLRLANSMGCPLHSTQFELTSVDIKSKSKCNKDPCSIPFSQPIANFEHEKPHNRDKCNLQKYPCAGLIADSNPCIASSDKNICYDSEENSEIIVNTQDIQSLNSDVTETEDEIEIIDIEYGERSDQNLKFLPLHETQKKNICSNLGINYINRNSGGGLEKDGNIGHPVRIKHVIGDGNCFFRAVSYIISGTESNHIHLRKATVKHLLETNDLFSNTLSHEFRTVQEYVFKERVMDIGTWASNTEISCVANLVNTDVYSFNDQLLTWQMYSAKNPGRINEVTTERGIYILYTNGNHFDVVEDVATVDLSTVEEEQSINQKTEVINVDSNSEIDIPMNESCRVNTKKRNLQTEIESHEKYEPECKQRRMIDDVDSTCDVKPVQRKRRRTKKSANTKIWLRKQQRRIKRCKQKSQCTEGINADAPKKSRKDKHADAMRTKYCNDMIYRLEKKSKVNEKQKMKYNDKSPKNEKVRNTQNINNCRTTYREKIKESMKTFEKHKYHHNVTFQENVKEFKRNVYINNVRFRENLKEKMKKTRRHLYQNNSNFKEKIKMISKAKYRNNPMYRHEVKQTNLKRSENKKQKIRNFEYVLSNFRKLIAHGPEYVCCVCLKLLFEKQVKKCIKAQYQNQSCIIEKYVHICSSECKTECELAKSPRHCLWICFTCHRKLVKGDIPAEASVNNLELDDIPEELESLNNLEQHLTAINIPFMKIVNLPKGGQHGIHGPVVSVPSNMQKTVVSLPRQNSEDELIRVKLKRKWCYRGYYRYKFVNKDKVLKALQYLSKNNKWYSDITINEEWSNDLSHDSNEEGICKDQ